MGLLGILFFIGTAFVFSKNRRAINWHTVGWGFGLQLVFAFIMLGTPILSFGACFLLITLIYLYFAQSKYHLYNNIISISKNLMNVITVLKLIILIAIGYFMGVTSVDGTIQANITPILKVIWVLLVLYWIASKYVLKNKFTSLPILGSLFLLNLALSFGGTIAIAIASNFEQGTMFNHISNLSIGLSNFLSIPTAAGAEFLYGPLADISENGFIFVIQVLSVVIFFSAFISILYYIGIIQILVLEIAKFMRWTMRTSGAETLSCSANIFIGQTEAPILIKPFIADMTESELHAIMTGGFATIAGSVFAGFVAAGIDASYLIGASTMSAPAALMMSKIWYPETEKSATTGDTNLPEFKISDNLVGAASVGTTDGIHLAINIAGMLLAFISLLKLVNWGLEALIPGLTLEIIFGNLFQGFAFIMGAPLQDIKNVGLLLGMKVAINEFVAYATLGDMIKAGVLTPKSQLIATYALCGFANLSSIGIQVGGISYMAPDRKADISRLGMSAMICGAFASWVTACIAGILLG